MAWECFQDELERIKGENTDEDLHDFEDKSLSSQQETSTSNSGRLYYLLNH